MLNLTPPAKISVAEPGGSFGVRKLACAFHEEADFWLCKVLHSNVLKVLTRGESSAQKKRQQATALHILQAVRLLSVSSNLSSRAIADRNRIAPEWH